jgi:methylated-DNA-protein-cysteine methyltransferase-like protein
MSYGQVARVLGAGYDARAIGNIMHATPDDGRHIPWHRVINAQGGCSTAGMTTPPDLQQRLLETEGLVFDEKGRCRIKTYLWTPPEYEEETKRENENQGGLFS